MLPAGKRLEAELAATKDPPPLLHPEMARIYRTKVAELAKALQESDSRCEATEALRGLVDAIVLTPDEGRKELQIELRGQPGGDAQRDGTNEEVVGIRRPLPASIFGCGGGI
jgi:hypothetical protein